MSDKFRMFDILDVDMGGTKGRDAGQVSCNQVVVNCHELAENGCHEKVLEDGFMMLNGG